MPKRSGKDEKRAQQVRAKKVLWKAAAQGRELPPEQLPQIAEFRFMNALVRAAIWNDYGTALAYFVNGDVKQWLHPADVPLLERARRNLGGRLIGAAQWGSDNAVIALLLLKAPVNYETRVLGITPLLQAADFGQSSTARLLIDAKADVNHAGQFRRTAAYHAAGHGDVGLLQALIEAKADVDITDVFGEKPVSNAAERLHWPVVELLGKERLPLEYQTTLAVIQGDVAEVQRLIDAKAMVNACRCGMTHLARAASEGHVHIVGQLIAAKATVGASYDASLICAASKGHVPVVQLLLEAKAPPDWRMRHYSPVKMAMSEGHDAVVQLLLAAKAAV
jgi:ankyrin repeat protein